MREHSRDRGRLEDILKYAQNVEQIISGVSLTHTTPVPMCDTDFAQKAIDTPSANGDKKVISLVIA